MGSIYTEQDEVGWVVCAAAIVVCLVRDAGPSCGSNSLLLNERRYSFSFLLACSVRSEKVCMSVGLSIGLGHGLGVFVSIAVIDGSKIATEGKT